MKDFEDGVGMGLFIGILVMTVSWLFIAYCVEGAKTEKGYLTYEGDVYSVTKLYNKAEHMKDMLNSNE